MEGLELLDFAGPPTGGRTARSVALILFSLIFVRSSAGQTASSDTGLNAHIQQLFEQSRWQEIVDELHSVQPHEANLCFFYGSALAQLGDWESARRALLEGHRLAQHDKRFPIELAGVAFKQQRYSESAAWLRRALRIDSSDKYANDFLGTVYFLQGNLEAALKYWNRVDKPQIESVKPDHPFKIRPALLDRALTFAPGDALLLPAFLTSRARVNGLGIFPVPDLQIAARDDARFDVVLNLQERNGWGASKAAALVSTFSGVAYQTVYPEYFNLAHSAINITSLFRWDVQKRRISAGLSGPLQGNPKYRYRFGLDLRNENWVLRPFGMSPVFGSLNLRREVATAEVNSFESGRWNWSTGVELSHRDYRNVDFGTAITPQMLAAGAQLKVLAPTRYDLWRNPDRRLVVSSSASVQIARIWSQATPIYSKLQGSVLLGWLPKAKGDDYATHLQIRAGGAAGSIPFDELYVLGLERDNDLWLRGHVATRDGRKGSAPLGTHYFLSNFDVDKKMYSNGLLTMTLGPFLDSGTVSGSAPELGSHRYLWDVGLQLKLRVLGQNLTFSWGKDLRTGNNAWYFTGAERH
jgi:tetratricopeptide (TPR) repeat protein